MNILKMIYMIAIGIGSITGCKNKTEKKQDQESSIQDSIVQNDLPVKDGKEPFHKSLSLQNISFDIQTKGQGSIRQLLIQPGGLEKDNRLIEFALDGQVVDVEIEDLNSDGFPELLIYTQSIGSGSYGNVIGYSVNNGKSISQIYFPPIEEDPKINTGYMGHDEFAIVETTLVRRIPIYKNGDPNSSPKGLIRQIQYKMVDGEASRKFVVDKVLDLDLNL